MKLLLIYLLTVVSVNSADLYASISNLRTVLESESILLDSANYLIKSENERLDRIRSFLEDARLNPVKNSINEKTDIETYIGHPLNAFSLIKRLANGWGFIFQSTALNNQESSESFKLPDESDINGAADAIVRLQRTYRLLTKDLVNGYVQGKPSHEMDYVDCYTIGMAAKRSGDFGIALQWLNNSLEKNKENKDTVLSLLIKEIADLYISIGNYQRAIEVLLYGIDRVQDDQTREYLIEYYKEQQENQVDLQEQGYTDPYDEYSWPKHMAETSAKYEALCRGDKDAIRKTSKALRCRYVRSRHVPFEYFKQEIFNYKPFISLFHDIISDDEIKHVQELASPLLSRAKIGAATNPKLSNHRIGKVGWLRDDQGDGIMLKLTKRINRATGLSTKFRTEGSDSEPFQVVNYGIGGQYEPHLDFYDDRDYLSTVPDFIQGTGDRISTWMFYLSKVEAGGATVFPQVGVRLPPVKNAAAFWYNFEKDGSMDMSTEHAGCPVLLGHKWVANKWVRENGQIFTRPCGKDANEMEADEYLLKLGYSPKDIRET